METTTMRSLTGFICAVVVAAVATIGTLAPPALCAGPDWVLLDENKDSTFFYDQSYAKKPNGVSHRVRTRVIYTAEGKADALKILAAKKFQKLFETRYLHDLDCKKGKSRLLEASHLDDEGVTLKTTDLASSTEWEDIVPDTRMDLVVDKVCKDN
jgi:hypothetical protein